MVLSIFEGDIRWIDRLVEEIFVCSEGLNGCDIGKRGGIDERIVFEQYKWNEIKFRCIT